MASPPSNWTAQLLDSCKCAKFNIHYRLRWRGGVTVRLTPNQRSRGCEFDPRPFRCHVTTLTKLLAHMTRTSVTKQYNLVPVKGGDALRLGKWRQLVWGRYNIRSSRSAAPLQPGFHSNAIACVGKQPIMVATASTKHSYWLALAFVAWNFHATNRYLYLYNMFRAYARGGSMLFDVNARHRNQHQLQLK